MPVIRQEIDAFHLALVARAEAHLWAEPELLVPFHVRGACIRRARLVEMLTASDLADVAAKAVGLAIDELPHELSGQAGPARAVGPSLLEVMAWNRFLRLANRAFRVSHMGLGAVVGYMAILRVRNWSTSSR